MIQVVQVVGNASVVSDVLFNSKRNGLESNAPYVPISEDRMNFRSVLLLIILFPQIAFAEFRCTSEVKYRWKKTEGPEVSSFWATVQQRGATEKEAREATKGFADRERGRARDACVRQHQNLSGCITSKMASYQEAMQNLPFSARAKIEESIVSDCERSLGNCVGVDVSEPACEDLAPPPAVEEDEEEESGKKGKGKGKKKR